MKINKDGSIEPFTSLTKVFSAYPELRDKKENIVTYLTRFKKPYHGDGFLLKRLRVNNKIEVVKYSRI